ncbi:MAG: JAB domain-containing protein [Alkaliphilus sp.]
MSKKIEYKDSFFKSLNKLTGVPIGKIRNYAKENNPFNILEHPLILNPNEKQLEKLNKLNEFVSSYNVLRINEENNRIKLGSAQQSGEYFVALLSGMKDKERFMVAFLDTGNKIIETRTVSEGGIASTVVYPREILKLALANDCNSIILAHCHPSGRTTPSREDIEITKRINSIFDPLGIKVLDHIIVGGNKYSSMLEDKNMPLTVDEKVSYDEIKISEKDRAEEESTTYENDFEEENELEM